MTDHTRPSLQAVLTRHGLDRLNEGPGWRKVLCPYHDEREPSAGANYDLGAFMCHACGMSGDAYKLLMDKEGLTFTQAAQLGDELDGDPNASTHYAGSSRRKGKRAYRPPGRRGRK